MASSSNAGITHVKVDENREFATNYCSSGGEGDAGEGNKRRRVSHDYRKLSKLGYGSSMSNDSRLIPGNETKGINHAIGTK